MILRVFYKDRLLNCSMALLQSYVGEIFSCRRPSQSGVGGIGGNATLVVLVPSHQHIATYPPVLTPTAKIRYILCIRPLCLHLTMLTH